MARTETVVIGLATRIGAALLGVIPAFVVLSVLFSDAPQTTSFSSFIQYTLGPVGIVAALHAAFGLAFGFAFPRPAWRWGLWLNVPILLLSIIFLPIFLSNLAVGDVNLGSTQVVVETLLLVGLFVGPLVAACLSSYVGARIRRHLSSG